MENQIAVLPQEVNDLAVKVSANKQEEVSNVLTQIFTGTASWEEQVNAIEVKGVDDIMGMELADVARKNVKKARLSAEKIFDAKRDEVKALKSEYDLEDKLWLKAKQIMELKFKAIEDKATWKAEYAKRYKTEQKEKKIQERMELIGMYEIPRAEIENMSDESFTTFLETVKANHEKKVQEQERIRKEEEAEKAKHLEIIAEQAKENERLKKELEAKTKLEEEEKAANEKAKKDAEKLAKAPIKKQLNVWIESFTAPEISISNEKTKSILEKFEGFKQWAKREVEGM